MDKDVEAVCHSAFKINVTSITYHGHSHGLSKARGKALDVSLWEGISEFVAMFSMSCLIKPLSPEI